MCFYCLNFIRILKSCNKHATSVLREVNFFKACKLSRLGQICIFTHAQTRKPVSNRAANQGSASHHRAGAVSAPSPSSPSLLSSRACFNNHSLNRDVPNWDLILPSLPTLGQHHRICLNHHGSHLSFSCIPSAMSSILPRLIQFLGCNSGCLRPGALAQVLSYTIAVNATCPTILVPPQPPALGLHQGIRTLITTMKNANSQESFQIRPFITQMTDYSQGGPVSDLFKATQLANGNAQIQTGVSLALKLEFAITAFHDFLE